MSQTSLNSKIVNASKWSTITEVIAKLVAPISSMVLARVLTPEAFGVVATITMIISFAEIFTDAGFQRYLIQYEFENDEEKSNTANVAFWTNLGMSLFLWLFIGIFSDKLAIWVGNPGLGNVITIACVSIPLAAFSSIQMALYKRSFDFKTLFYVRLVGMLIPLFVTMPLAFWLRSYWALVVGTIVIHFSNAVILTLKSNWRPRLFYDVLYLKKMFSFCSWTVLDTILVWATSYIDIFLIGVMLNEYYLGLYKTSIATVGQIVSIITAGILPILMPSLSRVQNDFSEMRALLLKFQKYMAIILLPLGVGIFMFSDLITTILLGEQWTEASTFIGLWGLMEVVTIIFARFCSVIYPAIGKPRISVLVQILHLAVLIPAVYIAVQYGFTTLYWTRSLVRLELVLVNVIFAYMLIRQSPWKMFKNILPEAFSAFVMGWVAYILLGISNSILMSFLYIPICIVVYFGLLYVIPGEKDIMLIIKNKVLKK